METKEKFYLYFRYLTDMAIGSWHSMAYFSLLVLSFHFVKFVKRKIRIKTKKIWLEVNGNPFQKFPFKKIVEFMMNPFVSKPSSF